MSLFLDATDSKDFAKKYIYDTILTNNVSKGIVNDTKSIIKARIKNVFGKEYFISGLSNLGGKYNIKLLDFIKAHDKNFNFHFNIATGYILPFINISMIDPRTFIIIATKQYIPGKEIEEKFSHNNEAPIDLYIYIFGKHSPKYIKELNEILVSRQISNRNDVIYSVNKISSNDVDISCINLSKRKIDSLIYSDKTVDKIKEHIDRFLHGKEFYTDKELSYKTGILLYGKPGTGKSSLVKGIATEYSRSIISVDVSNIGNIDFAKLSMMINNEDQEQYVVLFEDIDTLFLNREESDKHDKNYNDIINKLLQFLDSNQSPSNVIFIATTNYVERLDAALIRDGRFDLKLEVGELNKEDISKFLMTFDLEPTKDLIDSVIGDYMQSCKLTKHPDTYNQSKLQNIILKYIKLQKMESQGDLPQEIEEKKNKNKLAEAIIIDTIKGKINTSIRISYDKNQRPRYFLVNRDTGTVMMRISEREYKENFKDLPVYPS